MTSISKIDAKAEKFCDTLVSDYPDVWYCLDGYAAYIWLTPWNNSDQPSYKITEKLECIELVPYSFSEYKAAFLKAVDRIGRYTNEQLLDIYYQDYTNYCRTSNLLAEPKPFRHL